MVGRIVGGWMMVTTSYFLTLGAMFTLYWLIFQTPVDHHWDRSGLFIGIPLVIIPYLLAGMYVKKVFDKKCSGALWVSLIPVFCERLLIYFIGYLLILAGGDGSTNGITTMMFIRGEAAPYFTYTYIFGGVVSVLVCLMIASYKPKQR